MNSAVSKKTRNIRVTQELKNQEKHRRLALGKLETTIAKAESGSMLLLLQEIRKEVLKSW